MGTAAAAPVADSSLDYTEAYQRQPEPPAPSAPPVYLALLLRQQRGVQLGFGLRECRARGERVFLQLDRGAQLAHLLLQSRRRLGVARGELHVVVAIPGGAREQAIDLLVVEAHPVAAVGQHRERARRGGKGSGLAARGEQEVERRGELARSLSRLRLLDLHQLRASAVEELRCD